VLAKSVPAACATADSAKPSLFRLLFHVAPSGTALVALIWAATDGGYPTTSWYPGAVVLAALATIQALGGLLGLGRNVQTYLVVAFVAFGVLEALSILWASDKGVALDATNETLVYAIVLLVFAGWTGDARTKQWLALVFVLAMATIGISSLFEAAHHVSSSMLGRRLASPTGYPNATAALFLIPFWPAVALGASRVLPAPVRALSLAAAAALAAVSYIPQSRGAVFTFPIAALVLLVAARARVRMGIALLVALSPTLLLLHRLDGVYAATTSSGHAAALEHAAWAVLAAAGTGLTLGAIYIVVADRIGRPSRAQVRVTRAASGVALIVGVVVLVSAYSPMQLGHDAWRSFKSPEAETGAGSSRFSSLGGNRYDFWRVALATADDHPIVGVGAGNFAEQYLQHRRSKEQPQYSHSVEMNVLSQTGAVGSLLFVLFIGIAIRAFVRARNADPQSAVFACGALTAFSYWMLHGSVDWLWEFPALGAISFMFLGLAASPSKRPSRPSKGQTFVAIVVVCAGLAMIPPWLAARQVDRASSIWRTDPSLAYRLLRQAARLNPISEQPLAVQGTIAAERHQSALMEASFRAATERDVHNWFSQGQLALVLAQTGRWQLARAAADRAERLNPREPLVHDVAAGIARRRPLGLRFLNLGVAKELDQINPILQP
jgi:O-antigen ligase